MDENFIETTCWLCMKDYEDLKKLKDISEYALLIKDLSQIEIFQDVLIPTKICHNCVGLLLLSNMFRINVVESQQKWIEFTLDENKYKDIEIFDQNLSVSANDMCRICFGDATNFESYEIDSVYLLPEKIKGLFLNIHEYQRHPDIPEKLCAKCISDLKTSYQVIQTCESLNLHEHKPLKCLICENDCKSKYHTGIKELTSLVLTLMDVPDQETVYIVRDSRYCDSCIESLRIAKSVRYKSYKSEEVLKLQFQQESDISDNDLDIDSVMHVEYLEEDALPVIKADNESNHAYYNSPIADDSEEETDFFSIQLNTPPVQIFHRCPECPATFTHKPDLVMHHDVLHVTKGTVCNECGMSCKNIGILRQHKIRVHYQLYDHLCDICGRQFPGKSKYQAHYVTHFDARNVLCQHCPAKFKTKKALNLHLRSHTGEKPYKCEVCNKRFSHYSDKKRHTYIHTDKRPYNCEVCQRGFVKKNLLRAHMQQHGKTLEKETE